jgi:hypothetical protein
MVSGDFDALTNALSTGSIIAIVIGSIIGLVVCIGFIFIVIFIINHCNKPRYLTTQGMVLQQQYPYPHSWTADYPPSTTSISNYPPETTVDSNYPPPYQSLPPPYTASAPESTKPSYT